MTGSLARCMTGILGVITAMDGNEAEILRLKGLAEQGHGQWSLLMLQEYFLQAIQEAAEYMVRLRRENSLGESSRSSNT